MRPLLFALASLPALAYAHPGHSPYPANTPAHYLLTPEHAGGALLVVVVLASVVFLMRRASQRLDE